MTTLARWAADWKIDPTALVDLQRRMGAVAAYEPDARGSEAGVASRMRLAASRDGDRLWRNNVGALLDARGIPVRFGLANDSAELNRALKSADLIGWKRVRVTSDLVGCTLAVFYAVETKAPGWRFTGNERERAQLSFLEMVLAAGGIAQFSNGA